MKILVVESSPLPTGLSRALHAQHAITTSDLGKKLLFQLIRQRYQLVLIWSKDLPFLRLKKILEFLYKRFPSLNILICGSTYDSPQRASILMTGAKDCIAGSICADELLAKISIITQPLEILKYKKPFTKQYFVFDFTQNTASYRGVFIPLNKKELLILRCLLSQSNNIVSRKTLYNSVWDSPTLPSSNSLDVYISSLRRKIEKPFGVKLIESVKGLGYRVRSN